MEFDVPSVEVMTSKLPLGFTALTRRLGQLNVLELVRESIERITGMIVNIAVIFESLQDCCIMPRASES